MAPSTSATLRSPPTSSSSSGSPPDSPTILTPVEGSSRMATGGDAYGGPPVDSSPPIDAKPRLPNIDDLPPLPSSATATPLVQSAPHFVARTSPRTEKDGATFTSSSQPSYTGYRDRSPRPPNEKDVGFNEAPPPYLGPEAKKDHTEHASPFRNYDARYPLSSTTNGNANYSSIGAADNKKFYDSVPFWLGLYFCFNLGLTLFNKVVLVSFPFPYTLTGLHALSGCAGTYIALEQGAFTPARLTQKENIILCAFSVLYTINIAVSNISLQLVTVPFHQVVRAATPLFTIFITAAFLRVNFSWRKLISLLPVVAGVGFATYGDYYFTMWGLILTLLGTFLAALKTVVTNVIQTGGGGRLKLHPLDLLMRMSPLAFVQCVFYGWYTGELERVRRYGATQMTSTKAVALLINGIIACGLNIVSFTANKKAGALTMTVSANCKQVLTIALAVILFNLHITITNGIGIFLTLCGGACYAYVEYSEKKKKPLGPAAKVLERS